MNDFKLICEIGRGSYGTVYKARSLKDDQIYVIKKINIRNMKEKHQKEAVKEVILIIIIIIIINYYYKLL